eukprot:6205919-Pleurochrysis_carterae.AAC.1
MATATRCWTSLSLTLMVRRRTLASADSDSTSSRHMRSTTVMRPSCVNCTHAQNKGMQYIVTYNTCGQGRGGYLVSVAICGEELGIQSIASGVDRGVQVLPAVGVDLLNGVLPRCSEGLDHLANE